jgi:hypothetical protein
LFTRYLETWRGAKPINCRKAGSRHVPLFSLLFPLSNSYHNIKEGFYEQVSIYITKEGVREAVGVALGIVVNYPEFEFQEAYRKP